MAGSTLIRCEGTDAPAAERLYVPRGKARDVMLNRAPEILISGPAGTGKSRACLEKLHLCATRYPGMRGLIVRKTRESLTEAALVTFEEKVLPAGNRIAPGIQRRVRQAYHYGNGSEIVVGGMDGEKVMSAEYDLIYVQEATELTDDDWERLTSRLRNGVMPYAQVIADCNPDAPNHWLKLRCDQGQCLMLESRHEDNPLLYDAARSAWTEPGAVYIGRLDCLTGPRKPRLRFGRWVQAEGAVYDEFDRRIHVIPPFEIPAEWRRVRSIDFGYSNPFVCQWWALDPDGRMFLYREIYRIHRLVEDHAKEIVALSQGERIEGTVADHDAEGRANLNNKGVPTAAAYKAIGDGIQAVQQRLRKAGDERARLFVLENALVEPDEELVELKRPYSTEMEFDGYRWPKGQDGKPLKEAPVDEFNHGMDAARYAVAYVDGLGRPGLPTAFTGEARSC